MFGDDVVPIIHLCEHNAVVRFSVVLVGAFDGSNLEEPNASGGGGSVGTGGTGGVVVAFRVATETCNGTVGNAIGTRG